MTKVSVAMTTFNGGRYIREQISSILDQSRRPDELIICDDGSTDDTLQIIEEYINTSPVSIALHRNGNRLGYRANFLKAANLCQYDLIAFSDQDDVWHKNKIERCVDAFERSDISLWHHNFSIVDENLRTIESQPRQPFEPGVASLVESDPRVYGFGFSLVFHRSLLEHSNYWDRSVDFFDPQWPEAHDQWFFGLASALGRVFYCSESLALYRQHGSNVAGWHKKQAGLDYISGLNALHRKRLEAEAKSFFQRSVLFESISRDCDRKDLMRVASRYQKMSAFSARRLETISDRRKASMLTSIVRLALEGAYQNKAAGGAGVNGLLKDIASVVA